MALKKPLYKCVIFDCDGTLVDTLKDIEYSMNTALAEHGFPAVPSEKYRDMVGWGIIKLAELALPQDVRTKENIVSVGYMAGRLLEEITQEQSLSEPYQGIKELLRDITSMRSGSKKLSIAVLSNKEDAALRYLIDRLFGPHIFDAVCGLRPGITPKPNPVALWDILVDFGCKPSEAVFVGDSEIDIETARNAGCFPLGASWGFRSRSVLQEAGAGHIIDSPKEILDFFKGV